ncbi:MAG: tetratricopeptide repeat protein [Planctomycetota bacterium]|nr:MAG: tetratricopeptide repeat protein [Planctomycetota bacterium]
MSATKHANSTKLLLSGASLILIIFAYAVAYVQADVLTAKGRPTAIDIKIDKLTNGKLEYRLRTGRPTSKPVEQIEYLQITGWPLFNLAEKQQRDNHMRQAANSYEKLLSELTDAPVQDKDPQLPETDRLDRIMLVQCRLLRVYDSQGRFDRAVDLYLKIIERMPACLETLRPTNIPTAGSIFIQSALSSVNSAIKRHRQDALSTSLRKWRDTWPGQQQTDDHTSTDRQTASRPGESSEIKNLRNKLPQIQSMIDTGQFDQALQQIKSLNSTSAGMLRADLYYWQARAWLGKSSAQNTRDQNNRSLQRAALAFMRVVIHYPNHKYGPECLYRTGLICRKLGRPNLTVRIFSELERKYPLSNPWVERAQKELSRL